MKQKEHDKARFERRLQIIKGTDKAKQLRKFRESLHKPSKIVEVNEGDYSTKGTGQKRAYWHPSDEYVQLNTFLDTLDVDSCFE